MTFLHVFYHMTVRHIRLTLVLRVGAIGYERRVI